MNWLPRRKASGIVSARKTTLMAMVSQRWRSAKRMMGKYNACVIRETGFLASGRSRPRIKKSINAGTTVIASKDEKATDKVLVHASGRRSEEHTSELQSPM